MPLLTLLTNASFIKFCSLAGCISILMGAIFAALFFRGKQGERYSPLNHYISELGEFGVSRLAGIFNFGLIACGILLFPASLGLGLTLQGIWSKLGMIAGCLAAVAISLVGVFPVNRIDAHIRAAVLFFRSGLVMVLFFTIAILLQPAAQRVLPLKVGLAGIPAIFAYSFFLIYSRVAFNDPANSLDSDRAQRPKIWLLSISEWLIFMTTVPWFFAVALGLI